MDWQETGEKIGGCAGLGCLAGCALAVVGMVLVSLAIYAGLAAWIWKEVIR